MTARQSHKVFCGALPRAPLGANGPQTPFNASRLTPLAKKCLSKLNILGEAIANMQKETLNNIVEASQLASKADLEATKNELLLHISEMKHDLLKWIISLFAGFAALIVSAIGIGVAIIAWIIPGGNL